MEASGQVDIEQGVELADVLEQSDPVTVVKRAGDGDRPRDVRGSVGIGDGRLMSSSAGAWGSIERRRTLPDTSRPACWLTRAEVTCVPPSSSAPTSSRDCGMARPVTARTPSSLAPSLAPRPSPSRRRDQVGRHPAALTLAVEVLECEVGTDCALPALAVPAQPIVEPQGVQVRGGAHFKDDVADAAAMRGPRWDEVDLVRDGGEGLDVALDVECAARLFGLLSVSLEDVNVCILPQP